MFPCPQVSRNKFPPPSLEKMACQLESQVGNMFCFFDIHSNTFVCLPTPKLTNWLLLTLLTQSLMINNLTEYQDMTWPWNRIPGSGNYGQILSFDTNKPMICEGFNILWIVWLKRRNVTHNSDSNGMPLFFPFPLLEWYPGSCKLFTLENIKLIAHICVLLFPHLRNGC